MVVRGIVAATISLVMLAGTAPARAAEDVGKTLTDLEAKWSKASMANDVTTIRAIVAPDWTGQNPSGKRMTRTMFLADLPNGKVVTMTNHDVHVREVGDVAIVQGMDDEKSSYKGKDTSGTYSWTDVFQKRAGTWVAISSQVTKIEKK